jgi:hypothetical protein
VRYEADPDDESQWNRSPAREHRIAYRVFDHTIWIPSR